MTYTFYFTDNQFSASDYQESDTFVVFDYDLENDIAALRHALLYQNALSSWDEYIKKWSENSTTYEIGKKLLDGFGVEALEFELRNIDLDTDEYIYGIEKEGQLIYDNCFEENESIRLLSE